MNSVFDHGLDGKLSAAAHLPSEIPELGLLRLVNHQESEILRMLRSGEVPMRDRVLEALDESCPCELEDVVVGRLAVLVNDNAEDADVGEAGQEVDDISEQPRPDRLISSAA